MSHAIHANRSQRMLLPPDINDWVGPLDPVRFVAEFVDALDLKALGFRMSEGTDGRPHYAPKLLLSIWLYGWMVRVRSSRKLERALRVEIPFLWLAGLETPDHNTLWRFFSQNKKAFPKLFRKLVRAAVALELVGFALHALDGTKLASACSTETAFHRKTLLEKLKELEAVIATSMADIESTEKAAENEPPAEMPEALKDTVERKKQILAVLAEMDDAGVNHLSGKEPEARMLKTRDGTKLGFNAQIVVDHESDLIVAEDVVQDATDHRQLVPMVEAAAANMGKPADETVADKGYSSGPQMKEAERRHLPVLVPAQEIAGENGEYAKSRFTYSTEGNFYVCPLGLVLPLTSVASASGGKNAHDIYRCTNATCPEKSACTKDKLGRGIKRFEGEEEMNRQAEKLRSPRNQVLWSLRKEVVEHLFGLIKQVDGFRRFTAWGLEGARAQWSIVCTVVNVRKLLPHFLAGRLRGAQLAVA